MTEDTVGQRECRRDARAIPAAQSGARGQRRPRLFHVAEVLRIDDVGFADFAPAKQHLHEASEIAWGRVQVAGWTQVDARIADGFAVAVIAAGEECLVLCGQAETARRHVERVEDVLLDVVLERLAGEFLEHEPGNAVADVRIRHPRARPPANPPRGGIASQRLTERDLGLAFGDVPIFEVHVVEPGRVLEHVNQPDRIGAVPRIVDGDLGHELFERGFDVERVLLVQLDEAHRDERLADRADAEARVAGDRDAPFAVGEANAPGPLDAVGPDQRKPGAGHAGFADDARRGGLEFLERLRGGVLRGRRWCLRGGYRDGRGAKGQKRCDQPSASRHPSHASHLLAPVAPHLSHLSHPSHPPPLAQRLGASYGETSPKRPLAAKEGLPHPVPVPKVYPH